MPSPLWPYMEFVDEAITFRYPIYVRYLLRGSLPVIVVGLFLFSLSHGWSSGQMLFGGFCLAAGVAWWWAFRRYGLTIALNDGAISFRRGRTATSVSWAELTAVAFSTSGVRLTAHGRTWRVDSDLSGRDQFERLLRDRASAVWYRFDEDGLTVQRLAGRERNRWHSCNLRQSNKRR